VAEFKQRQQATLSTRKGEAWILLQAMREVTRRGLDRVQFESNTQVLTEAIRTRCSGSSEFNLIVTDIIQIMSSSVNFEVEFVRRQSNMVAHTLARMTNFYADFHFLNRKNKKKIT
jgi:hypothetical protein